MNTKDVIEELRSQRQQFLDGLEANQGDINLDIFEDFYPDKAHFVFELLQNAEDTQATECTFILRRDSIEFQHNGKRQFCEKDVRSITGIHNSTKTKQDNKIGKFGVGFKSVFIYTLTPEIYSGDYAFSIRNLVMPEPLEAKLDLGENTIFRFPFNNPDKPPKEAYAEIREGLENISELTLLFLKNIKSITWDLDGTNNGILLRLEHTPNHIEVCKRKDSATNTSSHFLRFSRETPELPEQPVGIAFPLEYLPQHLCKPDSPLIHEQFKIASDDTGRVSVFFPAEKETSGLRFHIHAPFVPTLDRSSIKEVPANAPLYDELAKLAAMSLHDIQHLHLLTGGFLAALPNLRDNIPERYQKIREAVIKEMRDQALTPTHLGNHAPAKDLIQAKLTLKNLLGPSDLAFLFGNSNRTPEWCIGAQQKNGRVDNFLEALEIQEWPTDQLVDRLHKYLTTDSWPRIDEDKQKEMVNWITSKPDEWMQRLYALLYDEYYKSLKPPRQEGRVKLRKTQIVKTTTGALTVGSDCFFAQQSMHGNVTSVNPKTFTSGNSRNDQKDAQKFLVEIGVREVGRSERIEIILKQRYQDDPFEPAIEDITMFIEHLAEKPRDADLFADENIFLTASGEWTTSNQIYLDAPFIHTGLRDYYEVYKGAASRNPLSDEYINLGIGKKRIVDFAKKLGAITRLKIKTTTCRNNPEWDYLKRVAGQNYTTPIDRDFIIEDFEVLFEDCPQNLSELVWDTLCETPQIKNFLIATYQKNQTNGSNTAPSRLVHQLRNTAWVPQRGLNPVKPGYADRDRLPDGFPFDSGWSWVEDINFGSELERNKEVKQKENRVLRDALGVDDEASVNEILELCKNLKKLTPEQRKDYTRKIKSAANFEFEDSEVRNKERRSKIIQEEAKEAEERKTEIRKRSVSVGSNEVRQEARDYLRDIYTDRDGEMICQICRTPLPFKSLNGLYYFEAVEFLPELKRRHRYNYLALCPTHAAMFNHANSSKEELKDRFQIMDDERNIYARLADKQTEIHFSTKHQNDLASVLKTEDKTSQLS